jgi:hypothetical protein
MPVVKPQPQAEEMAGDRTKVERAMGLMPMQKNGDPGDRDVGEHPW